MTLHLHPTRGTMFVCLSLLALTGCEPDPAPQAAAVAQAPTPAPAAMLIPLCVNDQCAVLDQNGAIRVGFDNPYDLILSQPLEHSFLFAKNGLWSLAEGHDQTPIKSDFTDDLRLLTPGYFGFAENGKLGVMDQHGQVVQAPRFDQLYPSGEREFIFYEIAGKRGILDARGRQVTEALYDGLVIRDDFARHGDWVTGERDGHSWVVNYKSGEQKPVDFDLLADGANGYLVGTSSTQGMSLLDAHANRIDTPRYDWIGTPGQELVAFRKEYQGPCGYMDLAGKTLIEPQFDTCQTFGKQGALVMTRVAEGEHAKVGMIDAKGQWRLAPVYDAVDDGGYSMWQLMDYVPGYNQIAMEHGLDGMAYGLFDVDRGVEAFKPIYSRIGALGNGLFVFASAQQPGKQLSLLKGPQAVPFLGVMDAGGKELIAPSEFVDFQLDASGQYLLASTDTGSDARMAVYDLQGRLLVPGHWQKVLFDQARHVFFAYDLRGYGALERQVLRAVFSLDGKPLVQIRQQACGTEQLLGAQGQVLWPTTPLPCPEPEAQDDE